MAHDRDLLLDRLGRGVGEDAERGTIYGVPVIEMDPQEIRAALLWCMGRLNKAVVDTETICNLLERARRRA